MLQDYESVKLFLTYYETLTTTFNQWDPEILNFIYSSDYLYTNLLNMSSSSGFSSNKRSYEECSPAISQSKYVKTKRYSLPSNITALQGFKNQFDAIESFLKYIRNKEINSLPKVLSDLKKKYTVELEEDIIDHYDTFKQSIMTLNDKISLKNHMQQIISNNFRGSSLHIVGSSNSGFGTKNSDLDLCLYLPHIQEEDHRKICNILHKIRNSFYQHRFVTECMVVPAKVPILKFVDYNRGIDVDININNLVGIRNTFLLRAYSKSDKRVSPLIIFIKHWAKYHDINDASRQTLSSYSLVLMIIHFLQAGCSPPVIPALQAMKSIKDLFHSSDLLNLSNEDQCIDELDWKSENTLNLGELLLNFFRYYGIEFDYDKDAASVRTGTRIPRSQVITRHLNAKHNFSWNFLCVEEPFNKTNTAYSVYNYDSFNRIKATFLSSYKWLSADTRMCSIFKTMPTPSR